MIPTSSPNLFLAGFIMNIISKMSLPENAKSINPHGTYFLRTAGRTLLSWRSRKRKADDAAKIAIILLIFAVFDLHGLICRCP
jgi:hypothetical protein